MIFPEPKTEHLKVENQTDFDKNLLLKFNYILQLGSSAVFQH